MRLLLMGLLPIVWSLTFGTLETKIIPVSPQVKIFRKDSHGFVYLLKPCRVLVCCDGTDHVHYFMQTNDSITRCLWTASVEQHTKSIIFKELREWYSGVTQRELHSTMTELDDIDAWGASEGLCDF